MFTSALQLHCEGQSLLAVGSFPELVFQSYRKKFLWGTSGDLFLITEIAVFFYALLTSLGVGIPTDLKPSAQVNDVITTNPSLCVTTFHE